MVERMCILKLNLPKPKVRYKITDYGQPEGEFKSNATIILV